MQQQKYQAINVTKAQDPSETWAVVYIPSNENLSHHETLFGALTAIQRYKAADERRKAYHD
jgi:hypothetical protein